MILDEAQHAILVRAVRAQVIPHARGIAVGQPIVEPLVVAVAEALPLQGPLAIPVRLRNEREVGRVRQDAGRSRAGQKSSAGGMPARCPHVPANTSVMSSIAMSQRTPSHCEAMSQSASTLPVRRPGEKAFTCATSDHGGKYGSRPHAITCGPERKNASGSAARSAGVP